MLEFKSFASGSSGNFYTVSDGEHVLAIECGLRFKEIQQALEFKVSSLDGCLISHSHGDHCRSYKEMMRAGINCYASKETWDSLPVRNHRALGLYPNMLNTIGDWWRVLPFDVPHDCPGTLGFLISGPSQEMLVYITDAMYSPYRFDGASIIAVECNWGEAAMRENVASGRVDRDRFRRTASTHMSLEQLIKLLKANDLSRCREIHLLHLSDDNADEIGFKQSVEQATGIPCRVAARGWQAR